MCLSSITIALTHGRKEARSGQRRLQLVYSQLGPATTRAVTLARTIAGPGLSTELREASLGSHLTVLLVLSCGSFKAKVPSQPAVITTSHFIIKSNARLVQLGV